MAATRTDPGKRSPYVALLVLGAFFAVPIAAAALESSFAKPEAKDHEAYFGLELTFVPPDIDEKLKAVSDKYFKDKAADAKKAKQEYDKGIEDIKTAQPVLWQKAWADHAQEECKDNKACRYFHVKQAERAKFKEGDFLLQKNVVDDVHPDVYVVLMPSGLWYVIGTDQYCVELQMKPMTYAQAKGYATELDKLLFGMASRTSFKLAPSRLHGGGQVHVDVNTAFNSNPLMFLNFMTDIHNLPAFTFAPPVFNDKAVGLKIAHVVGNAPPLTMVFANKDDDDYTPADTRKEQRAAYKALVDAFDEKKSSFHYQQHELTGDSAILGLAQEIKDKVYTHSLAARNNVLHTKYQLLNLDKIKLPTKWDDTKDVKAKVLAGTIELRAYSAQLNVEHLLRDLEALQARISATEKTKKVVYTNAETEVAVCKTNAGFLDSHLSAAALQRTQTAVSEAMQHATFDTSSPDEDLLAQGREVARRAAADACAKMQTDASVQMNKQIHDALLGWSKQLDWLDKAGK